MSDQLAIVQPHAREGEGLHIGGRRKPRPCDTYATATTRICFTVGCLHAKSSPHEQASK